MNLPKAIDYLVIGGGIAGLAAADRLKSHGKQVLVLERNDHPGGRMTSIKLDGIPADLGAQFIAKQYKNILAKSDELKLETKKLQIKKMGIYRDGVIDYLNPRSPLSMLAFRGLNRNSKVKAVFGLGLVIAKPPHIDSYHLEQGASLDAANAADYLARSTDEKVVANLLNPVFYGLTFCDLEQTSAAFLKALIPKLLTFKTLSYPTGVGELPVKLAGRVEIMYGSEVTSVVRSNSVVEVFVRLKKAAHKVIANKVIVAIPGDRVLSLVQEPSHREQGFFNSVRYSSAVILHCKANKGLPGGSSALFFRLSEGKQLATIHANPYAHDKKESYFVITLANDCANQYMKNRFPNNLIKKLAEDRVGRLDKFETLYAQSWPSAIPIYYPGYITKVSEFMKQVTHNDEILYCGDYLYGGHAEAAFTSGIETANILLTGQREQ